MLQRVLLFWSLIAGTVPAFAQQRPWEPTEAERRAASAITDGVLRAHTRFLADDLLEGRGPGTRGDRLAQRYIATQFESLGLKPAAPEGGWFQVVPLVGIDTHTPERIAFRNAEQTLELTFRKDFIAVSGVQRPKAGFKDAEVVFVGYGIVAPQYQWDDYKGADLRGKVLLMMNNDPSDDPELFAGKTRLYYGRWDYKYQIAAKQGAAAAIVIHTTPSAGYPWQVVETSWTGEEFELRGEKGPRLQVKSWVTEDAARRIAQLGAKDLDKLREAAEDRSFAPVPLGVRLSIDLTSDVREQESANVIGVLEGSDPELRREMIVYTAHHDHLGLAPESAAGEDRIYNGAVDNAAGVASLLAIAKAYAQLPARPRRSILFAAVAAEEQGLLGSEYLAAHPPLPPGYMAANINMDGINIWGRTRDVPVIGHGKSSLDRTMQAIAAWQGRTVKPDPFPDRGYFYRSDQLNFAKIGVPSAYLHSGIDFIGRPPGWGKEQIEKWEATHYHQPSDEYRDDWDLAGAVEDTQLLFYLGHRVANDPELPQWTPGDEFEAARKAALGSRR
ncbi:MAG: M20/M25/M40 family metallo-hydrolase [Planctomycetes bacterium]|nr:M20/M25/M40 family metallo-hydrolase [Planctomycetota bacterium]